MFAYSGISYPALLDKLIEIAIVRAKTRQQTQYSK
jgi:hypothetical protein